MGLTALALLMCTLGVIASEYAIQPLTGSYIDLLKFVIASEEFDNVSAAIAYARPSGVDVINEQLRDERRWRGLEQRWLVGIDWCRSHPSALARLHRFSRSEVRIPDGRRLVRRSGCVPYRAFHPKLFIFSRGKNIGLVIGSGNLSRSGLTRGCECGTAVVFKQAIGTNQARMYASARQLDRSFREMWRTATPWPSIRNAYQQRFTLDNIPAPVPTDDDSAETERAPLLRGRALRIRQLQAATSLWIEGGVLSKNRGPDKPGNQLMMSPFTRVFFGSQPIEVPRNTHVGSIDIRYDGQVERDCSLRFSDNAMDVLTLPVPEAPWPSAYDNRTLLFERLSDGTFHLELDTPAKRRVWRRRSQLASTDFRMTSGRRWGVF